MPIYRSFTIADGQGLDFSDMDSAGRWLRSQFLDTMGALAQVVETEVDPALTYCFCQGNGGAPTRETTPMQVGNLAGPIAQKIAAGVDGNDANLVVYYLAANELLTTLAAADPTNPRIDLIAVKLENALGTNVSRHFEDAISGVKTSQSTPPYRFPKLTKQVVTGTPGATPAEPSAPAGYVKWCAVLVPATATSLLEVNFRDHRAPIGLRGVELYADDLQYDPGHWTIAVATPSQEGHILTADAETGVTPLYARPRGSLYTGRILRVDLVAAFTAASTNLLCELIRTNLNHATPLDSTRTVLFEDITSQLKTASDAVYRFNSAFPSKPYWLNGHSAGYTNRQPTVTDPLTRAGLRITPDAAQSATQMQLTLVRFVIAGE